jgi:hypothetical protein
MTHVATSRDDTRGPWAVVSAGEGAYGQLGPRVIFKDEPRWVIDLLTRYARRRCAGDDLSVWFRADQAWKEVAP